MALATMSLAGCGGPAQEGATRTEAREIGEFHSVSLRGAADARIRVGPHSTLSIRAADDTLQALRTEVRHGVLIVERKSGSFWSWGRVDLDIALPELRELEMSGTGHVAIDSARGESLVLMLKGAGSLVAQGEVRTLTVHINGAADADLDALQATDALVVVNGTGKITVRASGELSATVNGVGSVRYAGSPARLQTQLNGVGSIKPLSDSRT